MNKSIGQREYVAGYLFILPVILLLIGLVGVPFVQGFHYSFTDWKGGSTWNYVGLRNFSELLHNDDFYVALKNNVLVVLTIPLWVFVPLLLAAAIHGKVALSRFYKIVYFFPTLFSPVIIGMIFKYLLNDDGAVNAFLRTIGLSDLAMDWLASEHISMLTIAFVFVWSTFGTSVIIYLAGLSNVNPEMMEAARIDGAGWLRIFTSVTLPAIKPMIELGFTLSLIGSFKSVFVYIYVLTYGGPANSTNTLDFLIYRFAFRSGEMGLSAAVGVYMLLFAVALLIVMKLIFFRGQRDE